MLSDYFAPGLPHKAGSVDKILQWEGSGLSGNWFTVSEESSDDEGHGGRKSSTSAGGKSRAADVESEEEEGGESLTL